MLKVSRATRATLQLEYKKCLQFCFASWVEEIRYEVKRISFVANFIVVKSGNLSHEGQQGHKISTIA